MNVGRADVGFTADGQGVWSPSGTPDELFFDLDGRPTDGDRENLNANLGVDAAALPITSPDGRFTITRDSGLPTAITDNDTGHEYRQPALQVLGWADDEHVVTLAGCSDPCKGTDEFKNGLVLMRYDGTDRVPLTGTRKGTARRLVLPAHPALTQVVRACAICLRPDGGRSRMLGPRTCGRRRARRSARR